MLRWFPPFSRLKQQALGLLGGALAFGALGVATAQQPAPAAKPMPPAGSAVVVKQEPLPYAGGGPDCCRPGHGRNGGHFVLDSICGPADCPPWTPLCCSNLGEGWTDAWIRPPNGPSGAPRQGWLNTFDGFFTREFHLFYFWTDNVTSGGDKHLGLFQLQTPLSRRLWVGIDVPLESVQGGGSPNTTHFGDVTITPRVMLTETESLSLSAGLAIRTPTGVAVTGGDQTILTPFVAFWTDVGSGVSLRGGLGVEVPLDRGDALAAPVRPPLTIGGPRISATTPDAVLVANLAVGQTLTCHDAVPFGDFTWYLSANLRQDLETRDEHTFFSLTPGIRTHLGNNLFLLAAYEFTLVGPRPFDQRWLVGFVKGW